MSEPPDVPTLDAVETFVASLRQRAVPLNTIKSYAHNLRLFVQVLPKNNINSERGSWLSTRKHY